MAAIPHAHGGSWTWTGNGGNVNWTTVGNWGGTAPTSASTTDLIFAGSNNTGTALVSLNQIIANPFQLNNLTFSATAGSFFLGGNALAFTGATNTISQSSSNAQTIANNFTATTNSTVTLTLAGNANGVVTLSGSINSGNGNRDYAITKTGTSTFTLSGASTYGGVTTITGGVLNIQNATALGSTASGTSVASGAQLQLEGGISVGTEALTLNGSGIASDGALRSISGNNSYAGVISLASASTIDSDAATLTLSGGIINGGFSITFDGAGNITNTGVISGTGGLVKNGSGTLNLSAVSTFSGGSILNGGTVIAYGGSLGAASGSATINSATLEVAATTASTRNFTLGSTTSTLTVDPTFVFTANGVFSGSGTLNKGGSGTLVLGGANTFSGATNITAGTLRDGTANVIPDTSAVTVSTGATFDLNSFNETIGSLAGSGTVTSGSAGALTLTAGGDNTSTVFSGVLQNGSGTIAFTKSGTGTLTLSGNNTYSGLTTVSGGILDIQNANGLGTTAAGTTVMSGATLQLQSGISLSAEPLTLNGNGYSGYGALRNLSGSNSFGGAITLAANSTIYSDAGTFTLSGGIVNGGFTASFAGAGNITESGVISGTGALVKNGSGTLTLSGGNTFSGGSTINGGTVIVYGGSLGASTGVANLNAATIDVAATVTSARNFVLGDAASTLMVDPTLTFTANGTFSGTGSLNKTGTGTMILGGANTFSGATNVNAGTLQVNVNNALGSAASGTVVAAGAVLTLNGVNYATAEPLTLNGSGISNGGALRNSGTSTFAGSINAATNATINAGGGTLNLTGGISKNGTTLTIAGGGTVNITTNGITGSASNSDLVVDGTTVNENTANSYNGPTYIRNGGILNANVVDALPTSNGRSSIILDDSGTGSSQLTLGAPQSVASATGAATSLIGLNGNALTVGTSSGTTTFAGVISGTGGLIKDGASTQIISGANTYSGSTTVNGGTLTVANGSGSALASTSNVTVNSGGTFLLGASDQVNNNATMTLAGGTFGKGNFSEGSASTPGVGALTLTASGSQLDFGTGTVGVLTFASFTPGAFTLTIDNWTGTANTVGSISTDRLIFASNQSANLSSFSFTGYGGAVEFDLGNGYWEVAPAAVPEPSTWVAAVLALAVAGFHFVRRRASRQPTFRPVAPGNFPK